MGMTTNPIFEVYTPVFDRFGPYKYDALEWSRFISVLPELATRIDAIETHLASGGKQPFVRGADRLGVEGIARTLELVTKRLDAIEQRLGQTR